jgi:hypothetical protein
MAFTKRGDSHETIGVPCYSDLLLIENTAGRWITSGASPARVMGDFNWAEVFGSPSGFSLYIRSSDALNMREVIDSACCCYLT